MKIKKLTKEDLIVTSVKCFFIALVAWVITSCATHYTSGYKFETPKGNFYTNYFVIKHDSIFMIEINRNDFYHLLSQNLFLAKEIQNLAFQRLNKDQQR